MESGKEELAALRWKNTGKTILAHEMWRHEDGQGIAYISEYGAMLLSTNGYKEVCPRSASLEEMQAIIRRIEELRDAE